MAMIMFGGGCFWGVEEAFRKLDGVSKTEVGYSGGETAAPTYEQVCSNRTGHAEVVRVHFDESIISVDDLLAVFWKSHVPTELNRQGPDVGTQYRSAIFYYSDDQKELALKSMKKEQSKYEEKIVTQIKPAGPFYKAEEYHQQYLAKRGLRGCHL